MGTSYNVAQRQRPDVPSERREVRQCYGTDFACDELPADANPCI